MRPPREGSEELFQNERKATCWGQGGNKKHPRKRGGTRSGGKRAERRIRKDIWFIKSKEDRLSKPKV